MPSPVPKRPDQRRRRNLQSEQVLPASGRRGRPPKPPVALGAAGAALWSRLWTTPQATLWGRSHYDGVAKRCQLEDMWLTGGEDQLKVIAAVQAWEDRWGFNPRALAQMHVRIEDEEVPAEKAKTAKDVIDIRDRLRDATG